MKEGKKDKNKLSKILPDALDFVEKHLNLSHKILIHCYQGLNFLIFFLLSSSIEKWQCDENRVN
jgi:hypothetical protein